MYRMIIKIFFIHPRYVQIGYKIFFMFTRYVQYDFNILDVLQICTDLSIVFIFTSFIPGRFVG